MTLLAPYGEAESIRGFRQVDARTVVLSGAGWEDTIVFGESGVRCIRTTGNRPVVAISQRYSGVYPG